MIRWLDTVNFKDLHPALTLASYRLDALLNNLALDCWITSGNDRKHKAGSKHYTGLALDYRSHHIPRQELDAVVVQLKSALGPSFYVELEDKNEANEHIHVQFNGQKEPTLVEVKPVAEVKPEPAVVEIKPV